MTIVSTARTYRRARGAAASLVEDAFLVLVFVGLLALRPGGAFAVALAAAIPAAIGWSFLTLHRPHRIDLDDAGITFSAYRRQHRFAWEAIERIYVRRFVVRDRILVRISPAPPLQGRYWLFDSLDDHASLVATLEERDQALRAHRG